MPELAALVAAARGIMPACVAVAGADPRRLHPLLPGEGTLGIPARRAEFSAGRAAAHAAMRGLGLPPLPVLAQADRSPLWPDGLCGSISHDRAHCLAAVARTADLAGIGLDLEPDTPLSTDLWDSVLLPVEVDWLIAQPHPGLMAKVMFSAKEAAYKAQYPQSKTLFGFEAMEISVSGDDAFTATFRQSVPGFAAGDRLAGRYVLAEGRILTVVTLPAP